MFYSFPYKKRDNCLVTGMVLAMVVGQRTVKVGSKDCMRLSTVRPPIIAPQIISYTLLVYNLFSALKHPGSEQDIFGTWGMGTEMTKVKFWNGENSNLSMLIEKRIVAWVHRPKSTVFVRQDYNCWALLRVAVAQPERSCRGGWGGH